MGDGPELERCLDAPYVAVQDGTGVWWCDGGDGHVAAEIGHWAARCVRDLGLLEER
jgi:hypothetical protein